MSRVDHCLLTRSLTGLEDECGDVGLFTEYEGGCFFALIDGVGHGKAAREAATLAKEYLLEDCRRDLVEMMNGLHSRLKGSRGAVAVLCRLDFPDGLLHYVGAGNISVRIFGARDYRLVSRDGIIGYMMASPREGEERLQPGDLLILSSDGIREHFDPCEFPGLLTGSACKIAADILGGFGKGNDDASCMVLRYER